MFTNWKQNPQQMIRNQLVGGGGTVAGGAAMPRPPMQQPMPGAVGGGFMPGSVAGGGQMADMPQTMPNAPQMGMQGNMMAPAGMPPPQMNMPSNMMGRPMTMPPPQMGGRNNMMGRPMGTPPGQNPVMSPRQQLLSSFTSGNGAGLMGYRPGR